MFVGQRGHVAAEVRRSTDGNVAHDLDHQEPEEALQDAGQVVLVQRVAFV